jgi:hypothetical protein
LLVHSIEQSTFFLLSAVLPHPTDDSVLCRQPYVKDVRALVTNKVADESARFKLVCSSQIVIIDIGATANRPYMSDEWLSSLNNLVRRLLT